MNQIKGKVVRYTGLSTAVMGLGLMVGCVANTENKTEEGNTDRPNIVVILADDAGYADFGFMGSNDLQTPNIDKLAANGVTFTDAHVSATVCGPSRAGLLIGRYQQRFGYEANIPPHHLGMDTTETTIADILKTAGYKTAAFGKWHLGATEPYHPNNRGFDEFWGFLGGSRSYFPSPKADKPGQENEILHNHQHVDFKGYLTDIFAEKSVDFIENNKKNPFFIYLSFNAVHTPMHAKPADMELFKGHPRQKLAAMTHALDRAIGKVMNKLEEEGLAENTLVFFLSDNGGAHNNTSSCLPLKGFKGNKFEGGHRVPFIVSWPQKIKKGEKFNELTSSLDIFATSMAVAGIKETTGKKLDGTNLIPHLTGKKKAAPHNSLFWRKEDMAAMRDGQWKLIRLDNYGYRMYNLEKDLGEIQDLISADSAQFEKMKGALEEWEKGLTTPWWNEDKKWREVTYDIHKSLMENREPKVFSPSQLEKNLAENNH